MKDLRINAERLQQRLTDMAAIGQTELGGVCRLALSDEDKAGRLLFTQWAEAAGCTVRFDEVGNLFALKPGKNNGLPAVLIGSHLDSQPTGGKYDGVLGVLSALEVVESLNDHDVLTERPIEIVSWTNEEGARFAPAMAGSGVYAGVFPLDYINDLTDSAGKRFEDELKRIGYQGPQLPKESYHASFELHIEQGPILEAEALQVGVVTGVQGMRWYRLAIKGKEAHAGSTPMNLRQDPIQTMAKLLDELFGMAAATSPELKVTVGKMQAYPGSINTIPGSLQFTIDVRHPEEATLEKLDTFLKSLCQEHSESGTPVSMEEISYSAPIRFHERCINAVQQACDQLGIDSKRMLSGAGHDSVFISQIAPAGMIFIPCKDGLSHNELESAKIEDIEAGTNVLLHAVLQSMKDD